MNTTTTPPVNVQNIFEVVTGDATGQYITAIGSVRAPTDRLGLHMAREIFFRREVCLKLGVRRPGSELVTWSTAAEEILTRRNLDKEYRRPSFFSSRRQLQGDV